MASLVFVVISLALLAGFVAMTRHEAAHGVRFFAEKRSDLDKGVERLEFIVEHVDLGAFVRDEVRNAVNRLGHAIAHLSLQIVREVERLLTRLVRHLRMRHEDTAAPRESAREFVKTLSDFKENLKAPEVPDIQ